MSHEQPSLFSPDALGPPVPLPPPPTIEGEVVRVKHETDQGWRILVMRVNGKEETWVGVMPQCSAGSRIKATGNYETKDPYGRQFRVKSAIPMHPVTQEGMRAYLASGTIPNIGPVRARHIVDTFGDATFDILDKQPERLSEVGGIGPQLAAEIMSVWGTIKIERDIMVFIQGHGASPSLARKIHKQFGDKAIEIISSSPYRLALEVWGVGFKTADSIARSVGVGEDSPERAQAALLHTLDETASKEGHVFLPRRELVEKVVDMIQRGHREIDREIDTLAEPRGSYPSRVVVEHLPGGVEAVYERSLYEAEHRVADKLITILETPAPVRGAETKPSDPPARPLAEEVEEAIAAFEKQTGLTLAPTQREAVEMAAQHKVLVVTGGPGVGKAEPVNAKVLSPTGWVRMGDLEIGDLVIDAATGLPTPVTGIFEQGELPVFRVTMDDGGSGLFCNEHLFLTKTRSERDDRRQVKDPPRMGKVRPLHAIRATLLRGGKGGDTGANHSIPFCAPAHFASGKRLPLDPWMLGAYLGDGHMDRVTVRLNKPEEDVQRRFVEAAPAGDQRGHLAGPESVSIIGPAEGERSETSWVLERLGLRGCESHEKFIPGEYLTASIADRIKLLQGLCDTDGSVNDSAGKSVEYNTASPRLRDGIVFLVGSLGGRVTWVERETWYTDAKGRHPGKPGYRMMLAFPNGAIVPVSSEKHLAKWNSTPNRVAERFIRSVEPEGTALCRCISIAAASQLYVTDDFIVTHNTTILRALLFVFERAKLSIKLAAPTGRAAKRMNETTGRPASTLHMMLGWDHERHGFEHHEGNRLPAQVLAMDEHSMTDLKLMDSVLEALPDDIRLVMMGDVDQLPSVGPGAVLNDMITSEVIPVVRLNQIFRQAEGSLIVANAHKINNGIAPVSAEGTAGEFYVVNRTTPESAADTVVSMVAERIPERFGLDPIRDVQVIVPMWKGVCGVIELNARLQARLNPHGAEISRGGVKLRVGDKVIQTKNNYDLKVFNGDMGFVLGYDPEKKVTQVKIDDKIIGYLDEHLEQLKLAYASTCHKQQGAEHKCVVIAIQNAHYMMLRRQLIYTAATRGKKLVVLISDPRAMRTALAETRKGARNTFLAGRLRQLANKE